MSKTVKQIIRDTAPVKDIICVRCKFRYGNHCAAINGHPDSQCPACPIIKTLPKNY